jgi:hypothetical protein
MHGLLFISFSLAKMGYFSQINIYSPGIGLSVRKGKELGKYTDGYTGYVHRDMAQDAVSVFHFLHIINGRSGVFVLIYMPYR